MGTSCRCGILPSARRDAEMLFLRDGSESSDLPFLCHVDLRIVPIRVTPKGPRITLYINTIITNTGSKTGDNGFSGPSESLLTVDKLWTVAGTKSGKRGYLSGVLGRMGISA